MKNKLFIILSLLVGSYSVDLTAGKSVGKKIAKGFQQVFNAPQISIDIDQAHAFRKKKNYNKAIALYIKAIDAMNQFGRSAGQLSVAQLWDRVKSCLLQARSIDSLRVLARAMYESKSHSSLMSMRNHAKQICLDLSNDYVLSGDHDLSQAYLSSSMFFGNYQQIDEDRVAVADATAEYASSAPMAYAEYVIVDNNEKSNADSVQGNRDAIDSMSQIPHSAFTRAGQYLLEHQVMNQSDVIDLADTDDDDEDYEIIDHATQIPSSSFRAIGGSMQR